MINASANLSGLKVNSQVLGDLNATVNYRPSTVSLDAIMHQDQSHQLSLRGEIPLVLNWAHGFLARIGNNQKMRLYSDGIRLELFAGVAPKTLKDAAGLLKADLALTGPPTHPVVNGTFTLAGAKGYIVPLGVKVSDLEMRLLASPTSISIAELSARAADGTITGNGSIVLHDNYSPGAIDISLQMNQWPAIATRQYKSKVEGEIHVTGNTSAPRVEGRLDVVDTVIRPNLGFLTQTAVAPPDQTIVVIQPGQEIPSDFGESRPPSPTASSSQPTFKNVSIDVKVNIHRNTWIRHEYAVMELAGSVNVRKAKGGPVSVVGEIETIRGSLLFHGKRFTLVNGRVLFTGGSQIDPNLNIDAQYAVSSYVVDIIISGTASKPVIKLTSVPQLPQSDVMSLILFGTVSSEIGAGQKATVRQQMQSIASGAAGEALSESLGLSSLGVSVSGDSVGFGHYINENTYLSISPRLGTTATQPPAKVASIQYFLRRWLTVTTSTMSDGSSQVFLEVKKRY